MIPTALLLAVFAGRADSVAPKAQKPNGDSLSSRKYFPTANEIINFDKEIKDLEEIIGTFKMNCPDEIDTIRLLEKARDDWKRMKEKYKDK